MKRTLLVKTRLCQFVLLVVVSWSCERRLLCAPRTLTSYHHSSWTSEDGLGAVFDLQQAPDGYLWLTTSKGIFRFDGVRFESVDDATGGAVSNVDLDSVFISRSGAFWFSTRTAGMLRWKDGIVSTFPDRRCTPSLRTDGVVEDADGSLWIQARSGLAHLHGSVCDQIGVEKGYTGGFVAALLFDRSGTLWVESKSGSLLSLPPGQHTFHKVASTRNLDFAFLHEAPDGSIWIADDSGLWRATGQHGATSGSSTPPVAQSGKAEFGNFIFDSDGVLWGGNREGISRFLNARDWPLRTRIDESQGETFTPQQGLTSNGIWKVLIDREQNVWIASNGGLDRLRRTPFTALNLPRGQETQLGVLGGERGDVWIGSRTVPLTHVGAHGETKVFPQIPLLTCIRKDRNGNIWVGGAGPAGHLWRIHNDEPSVVHYPEEAGRDVSGLELDKNGDPWLLLFGGNTYRLSKTGWSNESAALGRKPGVLGAMTSDRLGNVWLAFSNNLVRWDGTAYRRYSFPEGRLNISVMTLFAIGDRVWLGGTGGVVLFQGGEFKLMRWIQSDAPGRVSGIVETADGDLWINGYSGVTHVKAREIERWQRDTSYAVMSEHFEAVDGLPGLSGDRTPGPSLVETPEGRLWFATTRSVAWLEPKLLEVLRNRVPPTVKILSVNAGGKKFGEMALVRLPAHSDHIQIDYTALSLAVPERVSFRYKLDGVDNESQEVGNRRQVSFANLGPGKYKFHVTAANNDGVWSPVGAELNILIEPAYYQTIWFRTLSIGLFLLAVYFAVRWRIHSVTSELRTRLLERVSERERIARELHDTLLQSLFGLMLQFQTAADRLPPSDPTRPSLDRVLKQSEIVMNEGRQRIKALRADHSPGMTLTDAIEKFGLEFEPWSRTRFQIAIDGKARVIRAVIQEEILLIAREALMNAFTHANATSVQVNVSYSGSGVRIIVSDDGCGIDPVYCESGRPDHWGLSGMRERAAKLHALIKVARRDVGGTLVELRVPAAIAFDYPSVGWRRFFDNRPKVGA